MDNVAGYSVLWLFSNTASVTEKSSLHETSQSEKPDAASQLLRRTLGSHPAYQNKNKKEPILADGFFLFWLGWQDTLHPHYFDRCGRFAK